MVLTFILSGVRFISSRFSMLRLLLIRGLAPETETTSAPRSPAAKRTPETLRSYRVSCSPSLCSLPALSYSCCSSDPEPSADQTRSFGLWARRSCLQSRKTEHTHNQITHLFCFFKRIKVKSFYFTSLQISRCFSAKWMAWSWLPSAVWAFPRLQHARPSPILHRITDVRYTVHTPAAHVGHVGDINRPRSTCHWGPGLWWGVWGGSLWLFHSPGAGCRCFPGCSRPGLPQPDPSTALPAAASSWQTHTRAGSIC